MAHTRTTVAGHFAHLRTLRYPGLALDPATWTVSFRLELAGANSSLSFTETVRFPPPPAPPQPAALAAFQRVLDLLYVAIGTSYYKVAAPAQVLLADLPLAEKALPWTVALFRHGLGEFAYRNDLPHVLELEPSTAAAAAEPDGYDNGGARPVVPVGGGKDSLVTVEALRELEPVLISVNPNDLRTGVMDAAGLPQLHPTRHLDPQVLELNRTGAYNGHIPVTAINSLVAVATAVLHGLGPVVMSNERSASVPNLTWQGHPINHQWSKGIEAEALLREALAAHAGLPEAYFSLLRPLSELHIAQLYAPFTAYDPVMTSCNAAFKLAGRSSRWCGDCPKCRFVFLALAPFVPRDRLLDIFGVDLLDDPAQIPGYRELAGITRHKPFECVGETEETLAALRLVSQRPEWTGAAVVRQLRTEVAHPTWLPEEELARAFRAEHPSYAPLRYARALDRMIGAVDAPG